MLKLSLTTLCCTSLLCATTTMCFKKDHFDPSTIESIPLDGGECNSKLSVNDMKKNGYEVKDIKISSGDMGMNYIYIFNKDGLSSTSVVTNKDGKISMTKEELKAYLLEVKEEEKIQEEKDKRISDLQEGKRIYNSTCKNCHGIDGTTKAYGKAKPLVSLSVEEITEAMRDYDLDKREGSLVTIMKPYASMLTSQKLEKVVNYIQTLKK